MSRSKFLTRPLWGVFFGVFTLGLNALAHQFPAFMEQWYSRGLFQWVRMGFDESLGRLPVPAFYLFWLAVVSYWILVLVRRPTQGYWKAKLFYWLRRVGSFAGLLFGLFYWLWAFNYARIPVETQMGLDLEALDSTALWRDLRFETHAIDSLRGLLTGTDTNALNDRRLWPPHTEDTVRAAVAQWLAGEHFPSGGRVRGRFIYPEGVLFKFGASGVYWPFIGEGNLESGMHPLRQLPAMAHEMSHGFGFTDEGVCNFIAYAACWKHPNRYIAYAARLDYWETLAGACMKTDPERYLRTFRPQIPPGIRADVRAIRAQHQKFREFAPEVRYHVYDSYLKAQGISSGMMNYEQVLMLVHAWRGRRFDYIINS